MQILFRSRQLVRPWGTGE